MVFSIAVFFINMLSPVSPLLCVSVVCPAGTNPGTDGVNEVLTPWGRIEPFYLLLPVGKSQNQFDLVFPSVAPPELVEKTTKRILPVRGTQHTSDVYESLLQSIIGCLTLILLSNAHHPLSSGQSKALNIDQIFERCVCNCEVFQFYGGCILLCIHRRVF